MADFFFLPAAAAEVSLSLWLGHEVEQPSTAMPGEGVAAL